VCASRAPLSLSVYLFGPFQRQSKKECDMTKLFKLLRNERGATAIEYGLIAALIAVACITALTSVGGKLSGTFNNIGSQL
jgi:pilus assembly protein Flp/PilA